MAPDTFNQPATAPDRPQTVVPVKHACSLGAADRYARERGWDEDPLFRYLAGIQDVACDPLGIVRTSISIY